MAYAILDLIVPRWLTFPAVMMVAMTIMGAAMLKGGVTGKGPALPSEHTSLLDRTLHVLGGLLLIGFGAGGLYFAVTGKP